jgi:hypothetical protein
MQAEALRRGDREADMLGSAAGSTGRTPEGTGACLRAGSRVEGTCVDSLLAHPKDTMPIVNSGNGHFGGA